MCKLNNKKICFISCVNNERQYEENLLYINNLEIPEGYEVEKIAVRDAKSMTSGYNRAMNSSDAKYKVYLHQDTLIINKNFIRNILQVFESDEYLGLLGMIGTKQIPTTGNWWESSSIFGKVYENHTGKMQLLSFNEVENIYESVQGLDGLILITQYDVFWREDLFEGFHYYDISQCIEFKKAGFKVGIPKQIIPWVVHDCGLKQDHGDFLVYEKYRDIFLKEYYKIVFPLVSILIPAFNQTKYLKVAIDSAINQTYKNTEIIICDDSTNDEVETMVSGYIKNNENIKYFNNGGPLGFYGKRNGEKCFELAKGEYISFLFHDDEYYPTKVERMINRFILDNSLSLVASNRTLLDSESNIVFDRWNLLDKNDTKFSGGEIARLMLFSVSNIIGEPTTVIFKKRDLINNKVKLYDYYDSNIRCLGDIAMFLKLCLKGNVFFIKEHLTKFRIHLNQNTYNDSMSRWAQIDFFNLIIDSYENGIYIKTEEELNMALKVWKTRYPLELEEIESFSWSEDEKKDIETFANKLKKYNVLKHGM